jgi:dUTP pyrophosphatase
MLNIEIRYFDKTLPRLQISEKGDWIDLRAASRVEIPAGGFTLIPLGVSMRLPAGYEAHIAPRSSTFKKWGLLQTNGVGVVDNRYCGTNDEWKMPVYATRDTVIERGDRVCQFRVMANQPAISFTEKDALEETDRGGFGSTGVK